MTLFRIKLFLAGIARLLGIPRPTPGRFVRRSPYRPPAVEKLETR